MGPGPSPQPALSTPYTLQKNPQPLLRPRFPAQPNPNPNNRSVQLVQIIESSNYEVEQKECNEIRLRLGNVISLEENRDQPSIEIETPPVLVSVSSSLHQ